MKTYLYTYIRNCLLLLFLSSAAMAQDWATVNPDIDLPMTTAEFSYVAAMTIGPNNTPYALSYTETRVDAIPRWYVKKYTSEGWIQLGNDIPLTRNTGGTSSTKLRVATDGTLYMVWNHTSATKIFRLLSGASDWQPIGDFAATYIYNGSLLELDAQGTPYLQVQAKDSKGVTGLSILKYINDAWVFVNGPAEDPAPPVMPEGSTLFAEPGAMVIAADGTIYTSVVYIDPSGTPVEELQRLSPAGQWQSLGSLPGIKLGWDTHRMLFSLNQSTGKLYMYGRDFMDSQFICSVFDGQNITSTEYTVASTHSAWYADGTGTAYLLRETAGVIFLEKFDGAEWSELGTAFSATRNTVVPDAFTGNPSYLYLGSKKLGDDDPYPPTVIKFLIGEIPQQTITFDAIADRALGDASFTISASTNSELDIIFTTTTADKITLVGSQVTLVKAGRATIKASQAGDDVWAPASASRSFCIQPAKPALELTLADPGAPVLKSNASANVWYLDGEVIANQVGATLTAKAPGVYTVRAKADDCTSDLSEEVNLVVTEIEHAYTDMKVFPNPADDYIEVKGLRMKKIFFDVVDMTGRKRAVPFEEIADGYRIEIRSLDKGIYLLRMNDQQTLRQIKFVKK